MKLEFKGDIGLSLEKLTAAQWRVRFYWRRPGESYRMIETPPMSKRHFNTYALRFMGWIQGYMERNGKIPEDVEKWSG